MNGRTQTLFVLLFLATATAGQAQITQCGSQCPAGYHSASFSQSLSCPSGYDPAHNQVLCDPNPASGSFSTCDTACPGGFHSTAYSGNTNCPSGYDPQRNYLTCASNSTTFSTCDFACPSGYHLVSNQQNPSCPPGLYPQTNEKTCGRNTGSQFYACGTSCPAGYYVLATSNSGSCPASLGGGSNQVLCRAYCGNGTCEPSQGESVTACPADCSACGDARCTGAETASSCATDCTRCGDGLCTGAETASSCAADCTRCGDGLCTGAETASSCAADCTRCGDGLCTGTESGASCAQDCCDAGTACGQTYLNQGQKYCRRMSHDGVAFDGWQWQTPTQYNTYCDQTSELCAAKAQCNGAQSVCTKTTADPHWTLEPTTLCGRCGDGVCNVNESGSSCAQDCCDANTPCGQTLQNLGQKYCRRMSHDGVTYDVWQWLTPAQYNLYCDQAAELCTARARCATTQAVCKNIAAEPHWAVEPTSCP